MGHFRSGGWILFCHEALDELNQGVHLALEEDHLIIETQVGRMSRRGGRGRCIRRRGGRSGIRSHGTFRGGIIVAAGDGILQELSEATGWLVLLHCPLSVRCLLVHFGVN